MNSRIQLLALPYSNSIWAVRTAFNRVFEELRKAGFLLESDPRLPSVCGLIIGEPPSGSWWSHPLAHTIFHVNGQLEDHPDVLITKLISGKVTFVHRKLWSEIFAIGKTREAWQMSGLSTAARSLLEMIDEQECLRTDTLSWSRSMKPGDAARELEKRLLIHAQEFHTATGSHAKMLETWQGWARRIGFKSSSNISAHQAKKKIEEKLRKVNEQHGASTQLPWAKII
jgi:hypothetical protein